MMTPLRITGSERSFPLEIRGGLIARNTLLNIFGNGLPLVVGVLTIPFIVRWLGTDRFGVLSLAWVVVGYFSFFDLGLGRATTKFIAEALGKGEIEKIPGFFWTSVYFQTFLGVVGAITLWLLTPLLVSRILNIPPALMVETRATFILLALSLPVVLVSASFRGILEASQRFDLVNLVKIPSSIVNYVLPVVGILVGFGLPGIMISLVASRGLTLLAWAWLTLKVFPLLKARLKTDRHSVKPLMSFGGWVTISNLVGPILVYLDRFFIGSLITIAAVGFYSAPYEFVMRLGIIPSSLLMTLFPTFSTLGGGADQRKAEILFGRSVKYLLIAMGFIVVLLILTAKIFLGIWLGEEFLRNSLLVFQILSIGFLSNTLANVPFGYIQGMGRADITAKFHLIELVFYVPLTWILVKSWGINGAALSWTIRNTVDMGLLFWASSRIGGMRLSIFVDNRIIQIACLLGALAAGGALSIRTSWWAYSLALLTSSFLAVIWLFVFEDSERIWIKETLSHLLAKRSVGT